MAMNKNVENMHKFAIMTGKFVEKYNF